MNIFRNINRKAIGVVFMLGIFLFPAYTGATIIEFGLNTEFSGATPPEGSLPWLTAVFNDYDTAGSVELTLSSDNLVDVEYVQSWYFNLDPIFNPASLNIVQNFGAVAAISTGYNSFKADGVGGDFDILLDFPQDKGSRFGAGSSAVFNLSLNGLTAESFNFLSLADNNTQGYLSAAHIGGIGPDGEDSGWIAVTDDPPPPVPEPATILLVGTGILGLAGFKGKKRKV